MPAKIYEGCAVEGCGRPHKTKGFCNVHYARHLRGVPLDAPVKERQRNGPDICVEEGCWQPVKAQGLCSTHYMRLLRHGHTAPTRKHKSYPARTRRKCEIVGCDAPVVARGLCQAHYARWKRHGDVEQTRPADWGQREKHPLYGSWGWLRRRPVGQVDPAWTADFWVFANEVKDHPGSRFKLAATDPSRPIGPGNWYWREKAVVAGPEQRAEAAAYARAWRAQNPRLAHDSMLKKMFGIGVDDYERTLEEQGGVCFICKKGERRIDYRTGRPFRLAVDHCHARGHIRGLLCSACNQSLGLMEDDPARLRAAAAYLERGGSTGSGG